MALIRRTDDDDDGEDEEEVEEEVGSREHGDVVVQDEVL